MRKELMGSRPQTKGEEQRRASRSRAAVAQWRGRGRRARREVVSPPLLQTWTLLPQVASLLLLIELLSTSTASSTQLRRASSPTLLPTSPSPRRGAAGVPPYFRGQGGIQHHRWPRPCARERERESPSEAPVRCELLRLGVFISSSCLPLLFLFRHRITSKAR